MDFWINSCFVGRMVFYISNSFAFLFSIIRIFRMAEFKGIKPATKTLFSSFIIIISSYLETIGLLEGEITNSILPICSVGICTWLLFAQTWNNFRYCSLYFAYSI